MNYIAIDGLFYSKFYYADTPDYRADTLFYRHKIPVKYGEEFTNDNEKYIIVTCRVRKKYRNAFRKALEELPNKMALLGHSDYAAFCEQFFTKLEKRRREEAGRPGSERQKRRDAE